MEDNQFHELWEIWENLRSRLNNSKLRLDQRLNMQNISIDERRKIFNLLDHYAFHIYNIGQLEPSIINSYYEEKYRLYSMSTYVNDWEKDVNCHFNHNP